MPNQHVNNFVPGFLFPYLRHTSALAGDKSYRYFNEISGQGFNSESEALGDIHQTLRVLDAPHGISLENAKALYLASQQQ